MSVPVSTTWLLGACMEAKGKQDLWLQQKPEVLEALREQTIIQSSESSNRIEGVTIEPQRLRPVVLGTTKPRDRSEEEILGYRRALDWVFTARDPIPVGTATVLRLHELAQGGLSADAGRLKERDNEIIELLPNGERRVRFRTTPAKETAKTLEQLLLGYRQVSQQGPHPALLAIASCVFDLLCIHPFRDGNGRASRLLTTLLLGQQGFEVARYISLERLIEQAKEDYYDVLGRSSERWHEGEHDLRPWWNYLLSIVHQAYGELATRVEAASTVSGKSELIRQAILRQLVPFSLSELRARCPGASDALIRKVLSTMKTQGQLRLSGRGRGARWTLADGPVADSCD
ncbi:Fic family protein [Planctomycetota bacterium]